MLATLKGMVRTKHRFIKADVIMETCYLTKGRDDDHGEPFQGNKRHHQLIDDNLCHDTKRLTFIIVVPFLTQRIPTF
jgi:hypothetical protein